MNQLPILLATSNPAKQAQFRWLLEEAPLNPVAPQDLGLTAAPEEIGHSHGGIARFKASQWSLSGRDKSVGLAIASDGGMVIPALGANWQSLYTHRFAGEAATDAQRAARLLELMEPYRGEQRQASWVEALAIADKGRVLVSWEIAGATGVISEKLPTMKEGESRGFWAFSLWEFPCLGKSYRELTRSELSSLDDHWLRLKALVRRYLQGPFVPPAA